MDFMVKWLQSIIQTIFVQISNGLVSGAKMTIRKLDLSGIQIPTVDCLTSELKAKTRPYSTTQQSQHWKFLERKIRAWQKFT
jgi:hypothetical protein